MRPVCTAIVLVLLSIAPARAVDKKPDCITISDVGIVGGVESAGQKRLCRSERSARFDIVETAVYNASLTTTAFEKVSDPQLRSMRAEIEALRTQVGASQGDATEARTALARAQEKFVAELAARDRAYGEAIAQFRGGVTDIASTPEGAAALAHYNAGNEAEAIAILDRLSAANEAARQRQNVAEKRRIAYLALDARLKGKVSLASVIERFELLIRLDSEKSGDWIELGRLHLLAGKSGTALSDFEMAKRTATDDRGRQIASIRIAGAIHVRGNTTTASKVLSESLTIARRVAAADPGNAQAQRDLLLSLWAIAGVRGQGGDLGGTEAAVGEILTIARRLAVADPGDAEAQRDLANGFTWIGHLRGERGDLAGADTAYRESVTIARRLAAVDPSNAQAQHALSISLNAFGDERADRGDLAGADAAHNESLTIARRLSAADPGNAGTQLNFADGLEKIGNGRLQRGDLAGAEAAYRESLDIWRRQAAADPGNAMRQRDLAVGLMQNSKVRIKRGDLVGAEAALVENLAIWRRLGADDPGNAEAQRDISFSLEKIGELCVLRGDLAGADAAYGELLTIARRLAEADPRNARTQRDLSVGLNRIGDLRAKQGDLAGADAAYGESLANSRRLTAAVPGNAEAQRELAVSMYHLAARSVPGVGWRDVAAQLEAMAAKGSLAPTDRWMLDRARSSAAQEKSR